MLFEIGHNQVNTNLTHQLQNTHSEKINVCSWMCDQKLDRWDEFTLNNGIGKYKQEGILVGSSEKMIGSRLEAGFGVCLGVAEKCIGNYGDKNEYVADPFIFVMLVFVCFRLLF